MSRDVSKLDKLLRIVGFSLYLSFIVFFFFLFFSGLRISLSVFIISTIYFIAVFLALTVTRHIHFNILLRRKQIRKTLFDSSYSLKKFAIFRFLSRLVLILLLAMAGFYFYHNLPFHATTLVIIAVFSYVYFNIHKIGIHVINEGLVFDYGQFIVLLKWSEIKKIALKGNHGVVELKEKYIERRFYVEHAEKFRNVVRKFGFKA